jgi:Domain of unknown function (DUF4157)
MRASSLATPIARSAPRRAPAANRILQRQCACGQHSPGGGTCSSCAKRTAATGETTAALVNQTLADPGQAIGPETRAFMEPRLGHDFSGVRVHTGTQAAASAAALHANAYTVGRDIVFAAGRYAPGSREGRRLLAHELTHVVQQSSQDAPTAMFAKAISHPSDASEREAVSAANAIVEGRGYHPSLRADSALQADLSGGAIAGIVGGVVGAIGLGVTIAAKLGAFSSKLWSISQTNKDGSPYSSDVRLTFTPTTSMNCPEIAFVQTVKHIDTATNKSANVRPDYVSRMTASNWSLDRMSAQQYGWFGYNNNGTPNGTMSPGMAPSPLAPARLHDKPTQNVPSCSYDFETCAICRSGSEANKIYGALRWGFDVDAAKHLTSHEATEADTPSTEFSQAVANWNLQAKGPAAQRSDPNQQQLGPFQ